MDENEMLSRIDARGRAAAAGVHDTLADVPVPLFDPEVHPVALDGAAPRRWARYRWMSVAGIVALALVAAVTVLAVGGDGDGDLADQVGTVEPARRFVAGHLPEGFAVSEVAADLGAPSSDRMSGPLVLYGPDPSHPELAVVVTRFPEGDSDDEPEGEVVTLGDRRLVLTSATGMSIQAGAVEVDGRQLFVLGKDRAAIEAVAATVEVGAGDRPLVDAADLPDGWEELGQLTGLEAVSGPLVALRGSGAGVRMVTYGRDGEGKLGEDVLMVSSGADTPLDIAASRLFATDAEDVEVRGHPAVLAHIDLRQSGDDDHAAEADPGDDEPSEPIDVSEPTDLWTVSWEERPGEVVRVGGFGVSRDEVLAVAEDVRPVGDDEWAELERASLRAPLRGTEGAVELGEGTFSDGSTWLAYVDPDGYGSWEGEGPPVSGELPSDADGVPVEAEPRMEVHTTASSSTGVGMASAGGPDTDPGPFLSGITVEGGDGTFAWVYGLVSAEVATVELVDPDGEVVATVAVLRAGGYQGFLMEVDANSAGVQGLLGLEEHLDLGPPSSVVAPDDPTMASTTTVQGAGDPFPDPEQPELVARAADGTELGRQPF